MASYQRQLLSILGSLYFGLTFILSSSALSARGDVFTFLLPVSSNLITILPLYLVLSFLFYLAITQKLNNYAFLFFSLGTISCLFFIFLAVFVQGDYLRSVFHVIAAFFLIFLYRRTGFINSFSEKIRHNEKSILKFLFYFTLAFAATGMIWVLIHGYEGIILQRGGTEPWIIFNLYTSGYIFISIPFLFVINRQLYIKVFISPEKIKIDAKDYTALLGSRDLEILTLLSKAAGRSVNCASAVEYQSDLAGHNSNSKKSVCQDCQSGFQKATLCSDYRRIYNQILSIKKFLETLDVGTVLSPENKRKIIKEGWQLRVFNGVKIELGKKEGMSQRTSPVI